MKRFFTFVYITIKNFILALLAFLTIIAVIASMAAIWPASCWACDLATHFRFFFVLLSIIMLLIQLFQKRWFWIIPCLLILGLNIGAVFPFYTMQAPKPKGEKLAQFSILQFNLYVKNTNIDNVIKTLKDKNADVVALEEVEYHWPKVLTNAGIDKLYPYKAFIPGSGNYLYSKFPIVKTINNQINKQKGRFGQECFVEATLNIQNNRVHVFVVHTMTPTLPSYLALQQDNLKRLADRVKLLPQGEPIILVGDFNTSPFSLEYQKLIKDTGLQDSQQGKGLQPSWPSIFPIIPIDHVLLSKNIQVLNRSIGPFVPFSDHLPVKADLQLYGQKKDTDLLLKALQKTSRMSNCPQALPEKKAVTSGTPCNTCPKPCNTCDPNKKH